MKVRLRELTLKQVLKWLALGIAIGVAMVLALGNSVGYGASLSARDGHAPTRATHTRVR